MPLLTAHGHCTQWESSQKTKGPTEAREHDETGEMDAIQTVCSEGQEVCGTGKARWEVR